MAISFVPPLFLFFEIAGSVPCCYIRSGGRTLDLYTIFGPWWLMPLDTVSSISPSHIILVMQKSSGPGIAWGLSSGNPNNFNLIEFLYKNAKINEWIKLLLCLGGLHHIFQAWRSYIIQKHGAARGNNWKSSFTVNTCSLTARFANIHL